MRFAILLLLSGMPCMALADVDMTFSDGSTFLVKDGRVMFGEADNAVLYVPGHDGLIVLNRRRQTFTQLNPGFAAELAERMDRQMEQALQSLPPEQREQVRQQLEEREAAADDRHRDFQVNRSGKRDAVAGYDCHEAEIVSGVHDTHEIVCIASREELGISEDDYRSLAAFMRMLADIAAVSMDGGSPIDLDLLGGLPIRSEDIDYGEESELTAISTAGVDGARLEVPGDYDEVPIDALLAQ